MDRQIGGIGRRDFLRYGAYAGAGLGGLLSGLAPLGRARAAGKGTVQFGDIGVGDPGGNWSKFTADSGWDVNLVAFGNAPSAVLNVLLAGGGAQTYDIMNIVGGMQKPLVENASGQELFREPCRYPWHRRQIAQISHGGQEKGT